MKQVSPQHPQKDSPEQKGKKLSLFARLFGKKTKHTLPPHSPLALEVAHAELTEHAGEKPHDRIAVSAQKKEVKSTPPLTFTEKKETPLPQESPVIEKHTESPVKKEEPLTFTERVVPTPSSVLQKEAEVPKAEFKAPETITLKKDLPSVSFVENAHGEKMIHLEKENTLPQKDIPTAPLSKEDSIVGAIIQQSKNASGRARLSQQGLTFDAPPKVEHHYFLKTLSLFNLLFFLVCVAVYGYFEVELKPENNVMFQNIARRDNLGTLYAALETEKATTEQSIATYKTDIAKEQKRLEELAPGSLTYQSLPFLPQVEIIESKKISWKRALEGIEKTVVKAGGTKESVLKTLYYTGFSFNGANKQITLGGAMVRGAFYNENGDEIGTSMSLATQALTIFEQSPYFKDLKQISFTKQTIQDANIDFGVFTNATFETPIVLNMTYQEENEIDCRDEKQTCFDIPQSTNSTTDELSKPTPRT